MGPDDVPPALSDREQWICWRTECRDCGTRLAPTTKACPECDGKATKKPIDPSGGGFASSTDGDTWASIGDASDAHAGDAVDTDGIGFVFDADGLVCGVDLDDCRDPETGEVDDWAEAVIEELDSFTEVSPSGTGLHVYCLGFIPDDGNRNDDIGIEMYDSGRFFTVTGDHVDGTPEAVEQRQDALRAVHAEHIGDDEDDDSGTDAADAEPVDLEDSELIDRAMNAENGDRFERLWNGDTSMHDDDHSRADMALLCHLAFWTGGDRARMERLFEQSGLVRDKWRDRPDYRERSIGAAVNQTTEFYDPDAGGERVAANGGAAAAQPADGEDDGQALTPATVAEEAEVETVADLGSDRKMAYHTYRLIRRRDDYHFIATPDEEIFTYNGGVWDGNPHGDQKLRELGHRALGPEYGRNTLEELAEQVQSQDVVSRERMGSPKRTVPLKDGLFDIELGELREYRPEQYVLNRLPVAWEPDAECPRWERFIDEVVEDGMEDAVQEYVGYTLLVNEWVFDRVLLLVGSGSNGKSTFLNTVTELLGEENVTGFEVGDLAHNEYHVAQMYGAIANIDADITGGIGHGGMFKKLTGGDKKVSARHPYGKPFDFAPTTKQLYSANKVPDTKVDDSAFFRRWLIVEFPREFTDPDRPGPDKDPELEDKLAQERPGILNWALEGLDRLLEQGHFTNEGETEDKRYRWQSWGDTVDKFISDCIDTEQDGKHTTAAVHEIYKAYCHDELEETPESQRTLTDEMKNLQGVRYSNNFRFDGKKSRGFKGFGFTDAAPDVEGDGGEAADAADQSRLSDQPSQDERVSTILEIVETLEGEEAVAVPAVVDAAADHGIDAEAAEHTIDNLLGRGALYEPEDGHVRTS